MLYTKDEVLQYVEQEDVKFIRLAFCDVFGTQKNIAITSNELSKAFENGILFDASAVDGFSEVEKSDLLLFPDPSTLAILPWRPSTGRVIRLFCQICYPDGKRFESDGRKILSDAVNEAKKRGIVCNFGSEFEFYLFKTDENGDPTCIPQDKCGYMDVAPLDKGENIRREIVLTLEEMGMRPESSHHEEGPGQNEVDFKYSDALNAADNAVTFKNVVSTIASLNGLYADFGPKPIPDKNGNGFHINISILSKELKLISYDSFMAGIMNHICEITAFLNPVNESYNRLGCKKAPKYITWSPENRSQLIRIPSSIDNEKKIELRSSDCLTNPYIAFALIIYSGLDGMDKNLIPEKPLNINLFDAPESITCNLKTLPNSLADARKYARESTLVKSKIPESILKAYRII